MRFKNREEPIYGNETKEMQRIAKVIVKERLIFGGIAWARHDEKQAAVLVRHKEQQLRWAVSCREITAHRSAVEPHGVLKGKLEE
jgi:hypothetical protein